MNFKRLLIMLLQNHCDTSHTKDPHCIFGFLNVSQLETELSGRTQHQRFNLSHGKHGL